MAKLNQIVAIVKTTKETTNKLTAPLFQAARVGAHFSGLTQTYRAAVEGGVQYPDDNTRVKQTVPELLAAFREPTTRLLDVISTAENTNTRAFGDIRLADGTVIAERVPVTFLMQLEKQLEREVRGLVTVLPELDPAEEWQPAAADRVGVYETPAFETIKTRKAQRGIVLYDATDKHPAQTQLITEDVVEGYWNKKKFSGAMRASDKAELIERLEALIVAVKKAREEANDIEAVDKPIGAALLGYVFDGTVPNLTATT